MLFSSFNSIRLLDQPWIMGVKNQVKTNAIVYHPVSGSHGRKKNSQHGFEWTNQWFLLWLTETLPSYHYHTHLLLKTTNTSNPENLPSGWYLVSASTCGVGHSYTIYYILISNITTNCQTSRHLLNRQRCDQLKAEKVVHITSCFLIAIYRWLFLDRNPFYLKIWQNSHMACDWLAHW